MTFLVRLTLALCMFLALPGVAHAQVSRDQAAATAQRMSGGRVLSVDRVQRDGREAWRVKLVTDGGEVRVVYIEVETGRPL